MSRPAATVWPFAVTGALAAGWYAGQRVARRPRSVAPEMTGAVEMARVAVVGVDADGRVTSWNPASEDVFGFTAREAVGHVLPQLLFAPGEGRIFAAALAEEVPRRPREATVRRGDGRQIRLLFDVAHLRGRRTWAVVYARDISAQKRSERGQAILAKTAELLKSALDYERTLQSVADLAVPDLADWCGVDVPGSHDLPVPVAIAHAQPHRVELARELRQRYRVTEEDAMTQVMRTGESFLQSEIPEEALVAYAVDAEHLRLLRAVGFRSLMVVPLKAGRRTIGSMTFVAADSDHRFDEQDLALAEELARRAGAAVDNARLAAERDQVTQTLLATLRPPSLPEVPGWQTATLYQPAERTSDVGGDFYDVFSVSDAWMLVIGDVIGKGPAAAALTSLARWSIRSAATATGSPSHALAHLNADLDREGQPGLLSAACVLLEDLSHGRARATVAVAGHPLPVLISGGEARPVGRHALLLGVRPDTPYPEATVELKQHDALVLYTDGLLDAPVEDGRFGEAGLLEALSTRHASAQDLVRRIAKQVAAFSTVPQDDIAILAARRSQAKGAALADRTLVSA